jgi:predicted Zn finger-like uncharacterized protein
VHIRCERCSTLYELDETLLSPQGSPVQCTRCQHVFTAYPARGTARTAGGPPAHAPPERPDAPSPPDEAGARRIPRPGGPAVYRPPAPAAPAASPAVHRAPILKRDAVGAFEARLRWSHRLRWLVPVAALALAAVAGTAILLVRARGGPSREALRLREQAMALVAQDDLASLARAEEALQGLGATEPELRAALADAALARVLRASSGQEEGGGPSARALADRAREDLRALEGEIGPDPAVRRASAVGHALAGDREAATRVARSLRTEGGYDRWAELAEAIVEVEGDAAARTRGLARLQALVAKSPELLRGRYLLAEAQAEAGRRQEALATLEALLAANPRHERARSFRESLSAPVPQAEVAAPPPPAAPREGTAPRAAAPAPAAAAPAPAAAGEAQPEAEAEPGPTQSTAPLAPAPLPVVVPPKPVPDRTAPGAERTGEPGAGGDASSRGRKRVTPREHLLPDSGGG